LQPRLALVAWASALAVALSLAGCSSGPRGPRYSSCAEPLSAAKSITLPDDLPMVDEVELTNVKRERGFIAVTGVVTDRTVNDLYQPMARSVERNGFDILGQENEGFEAEVYFARATDVAGIASLRRGPCPEQVTYSVMYDPLETKKGRQVAARTRRASKG
jgi:hypothetical protein